MNIENFTISNIRCTAKKALDAIYNKIQELSKAAIDFYEDNSEVINLYFQKAVIIFKVAVKTSIDRALDQAIEDASQKIFSNSAEHKVTNSYNENISGSNKLSSVELREVFIEVDDTIEVDYTTEEDLQGAYNSFKTLYEEV